MTRSCWCSPGAAPPASTPGRCYRRRSTSPATRPTGRRSTGAIRRSCTSPAAAPRPSSASATCTACTSGFGDSSTTHHADGLRRVLRLAREQLIRPRDPLAEIEDHQPALVEPGAIQVARHLVEGIGLGLGIAADLDLDRVALPPP